MKMQYRIQLCIWSSRDGLSLKRSVALLLLTSSATRMLVTKFISIYFGLLTVFIYVSI